MEGKPVTIRLLDPPLHEFLPHEEEDIKETAENLGVSVDKIKQRISELSETNPMLGHRGCRLGITYPEITKMQSKAIFEAAKETGAIPEIMIPLVGNVEEFKNQKQVVENTAKENATILYTSIIEDIDDIIFNTSGESKSCENSTDYLNVSGVIGTTENVYNTVSSTNKDEDEWAQTLRKSINLLQTQLNDYLNK